MSIKKAGVIVYDPIYQKILVVSNQHNENIDIPKGGVKRGEDPLETAFRELKEETGLIFTIKPKIQKAKKFDKICYYIVHVPEASVYCQFQASEQQQKENIHNIVWVTLEFIDCNKNSCNRTLVSKLKQKINNYIKTVFTN